MTACPDIIICCVTPSESALEFLTFNPETEWLMGPEQLVLPIHRAKESYLCLDSRCYSVNVIAHISG